MTIQRNAQSIHPNTSKQTDNGLISIVHITEDTNEISRICWTNK